MTTSVQESLKAKLHPFIEAHALGDLSLPSVAMIRDGETEGFTVQNAHRFLTEFRPPIEQRLSSHPVVRPPGNKFFEWFAQGTMTIKQMKAFHLQYTVCSKRFPIAQEYKVANTQVWIAF